MPTGRTVTINARELRDAFDFVSAGEAFDNSAYISLDTGKIYWRSTAADLEEEDLPNSWLRVSGTTKMPQIDHGVSHQLQTVMALLFELKAQQQPFEFILPCEGPLHT